MIQIHIDGKEVYRECLPPHIPGTSSTPFQGGVRFSLFSNLSCLLLKQSEPFSEIIPFEYDLKPASTISVLHALSQDDGLAAVFDFAAYILWVDICESCTCT